MNDPEDRRRSSQFRLRSMVVRDDILIGFG